jgi:hypothetical protein
MPRRAPRLLAPPAPPPARLGRAHSLVVLPLAVDGNWPLVSLHLRRCRVRRVTRELAMLLHLGNGDGGGGDDGCGGCGVDSGGGMSVVMAEVVVVTVVLVMVVLVVLVEHGNSRCRRRRMRSGVAGRRARARRRCCSTPEADWRVSKKRS